MTNEEKLQERLNKAIEVFRQKEAEITELKGFIESKDKALKLLQDTYNKVFAENIELKEALDKAKSDSNHYQLLYNDTKSELIAYKSEVEELHNQVNWLDEDNDNLQSHNEKLTEQLEKSLKIQTIQHQINQEKKTANIPVPTQSTKQNIFTPVNGAFTI